MQVQVVVDNSKCKDAYGCHKCLQACARGALSLFPTVPARRVVETDRKYYAVAGGHLADCTGCLECVRLCPEQAITVNFS